MKQCPKCGSTYTDDSLSFCLTDGAPLDEAPDKTEAFVVGGEPTVGTGGETDGRRMKVEVPGETEEETVSSRVVSTRRGISLGAVVAIIGALLAVIAVLSAVVAYMVMSADDQPSISAGNNSSSSEDVDELKKRLEELGGRIEDSGKSEESRPSPTVEKEETGFDDEVIQRVNSPGDGFLALRDQPSSKYGNRIAKIPHGDIVVLGKCNDDTETIGGRTGHWCRVKWEGKVGWVFDVWLTD